MLTAILHKPGHRSYCSNNSLLQIPFFPQTLHLVRLGVTIKYLLFENLALSAQREPEKLFIIYTVIQ
jgi:hypothetical protein